MTQRDPHAPSWLAWLAAVLAIHVCFLLPSDPWNAPFPAWARLPLELPLVLAAALILPLAVWRPLKYGLAALIAAAVMLKLANLITLTGFGRPFAPRADLALIPVALDTLSKSNILLAAAAIVVTVIIVAGLFVGVVRALSTVGAPRDLPHLAVSILLTAVAVTFSLTPPLSSLARADTTRFAGQLIATAAHDLRDSAAFAETLSAPLPPVALSQQRFANLAGADVLVIFAEAYGRSAIDHAPYDAVVQKALHNADEAFGKAGFYAASTWAVSPTYGGESWLAHGTFLSGLPVTNHARYQALVRSTRPTLVHDFKRAGWHTIGVMAQITGDWPEGAYFGYDDTLTASGLGYHGPPFGYVTMPDQYILHAFAARALTPPPRPPVMATIALISSHIPWVPLPEFVPWRDIGDGSVFATARTPDDPDDVWRDPARINVFYARSIEYVLQTVTSFITTYGTDNTLIVFLGDHQPMGFIAGDTRHDVPVHLIARNPALLQAITGDTWTSGMIPAADAPILAMENLRARITEAFTPTP